MRCQWFWSNLGSLYIEGQGCVPVFLENLHGMSCSGTFSPWMMLSFSVGMEAFDELLLIDRKSTRLNSSHAT